MATPTLNFIIELAGVVAGVATIGLAGLEVGSELGKEAVVEYVFEESDGGTCVRTVETDTTETLCAGVLFSTPAEQVVNPC